MGNPLGVKRDFDALEKRRYQAQKLLEAGIHKSEVARRLGVHRQSVTRWAKALDERGKVALAKAGRAGRLPRMSSEQREMIRAALLEGPESHGYANGLWTVPRVTALIQERTAIQYHPGHVWKLLRQLGWTPQRPVGRALERNEAAIREWKTKQWPAIKKKPVPRGEP